MFRIILTNIKYNRYIILEINCVFMKALGRHNMNSIYFHISREFGFCFLLSRENEFSSKYGRMGSTFCSAA